MKKNLLLSSFAAVAAVFFISPVMAQSDPAPAAVITEIMYNPPESGTDTLEFIELYNPSATTPFDLSGAYFSAGVDYTFPMGTVIAPEGFVVVAINANAFNSVFGMPALQWTGGGLSNSGEAIAIRSESGVLIDTVFFDDNASWPAAADQGGASLVLCDPLADNNDPANWAASSNNTGVVINGMDLYADPFEWFACITVGIADDNVITTVLYPNPTVGQFSMQFAALEKAGALNIYNALGQMVFTQTLAAGTASITLNPELEKGFYVVSLVRGHDVEQVRLIVE